MVCVCVCVCVCVVVVVVVVVFAHPRNCLGGIDKNISTFGRCYQFEFIPKVSLFLESIIDYL